MTVMAPQIVSATRYRHRPTEVDAMRLTEGNAHLAYGQFGNPRADVPDDLHYVLDKHFIVPTPRGHKKALVGDWIVRYTHHNGTQSLDVLGPYEFADRYERVG